MATPARVTHLLSSREIQIVQAWADGKINKTIAAELNISVWTVREHSKRIHRKLDAPTRSAAIAVAMRARVVE